MTVQTRRFIDLADIIGLRFECKRCRASLELTLERLEQGTLHKCPSCHRDWALLNDVSREGSFIQFVRCFNELAKLLGEPSPLGFSLTLEIKEPATPAQ